MINLPFNNLSNSKKIENLIITLVLLFLFKLIFSESDTLAYIFVNEFLVLISVYFAYLYLFRYVSSKTTSIISIILNTGILTALLFVILSGLSFFSISFEAEKGNFLEIGINILITSVLIVSVSYIFAVFTELHLGRQKRENYTYFYILIVFLFLTSFLNPVSEKYPEIKFIVNAVQIVTGLLIFINSLKISWIAFLNKKQKQQILLYSVLLLIISAVNASSLNSINGIDQTFGKFSSSLAEFSSLIMTFGVIYFGVVFFTTLFHLPTAEVFDRKSEEISSLMDLNKLMTQVFDLKELAQTITSTTIKTCNSDAAWLVIETGKGEEIISLSGIGYLEAEEYSSLVLSEEKQKIKSLKIYESNFLRNKLKNTKSLFEFIAIAPLNSHDKISGYLYTAKKGTPGFDDDDQKAIAAYADYSAIAVENAKLIKKSIEKERLEKELDVARDVQYKILPVDTPAINHLEISALFVPAFEVGGDYYDFFEIDNNNLGIVIADVSGKGISAAFIMAEIKGIFESLANLIFSPATLLSKVNDILLKSLDKKTFVTAIYGIYNKQNHTFRFARAGHNPLLFISGNEINTLTPAGLGLGFNKKAIFDENIKEMEIQLNFTDIVVLFTDGITESQNNLHEEFGYSRFRKILLENRNKSLNEISNNIMREVSIFSKDKFQHDDITLVLLKHNENSTGVLNNV